MSIKSGLLVAAIILSSVVMEASAKEAVCPSPTAEHRDAINAMSDAVFERCRVFAAKKGFEFGVGEWGIDYEMFARAREAKANGVCIAPEKDGAVHLATSDAEIDRCAAEEIARVGHAYDYLYLGVSRAQEKADQYWEEKKQKCMRTAGCIVTEFRREPY